MTSDKPDFNGLGSPRLAKDAHTERQASRKNARVPLAIFTYNRPMHTRRLFESIDRNSRLEDVDVWIYSDAPKTPEQVAGVEEARNVVRKWAAGVGATVRERDTNLGLARSIVGAVNELINEYGTVIVLEDDLVIAPDFLHFMLEGLRRYADCPSVMQIGGLIRVPLRSKGGAPSLLPIPTSWGWATWSRAWTHYRSEAEIDPGELYRNRRFYNRFTLDRRCCDYEHLLRDCLEVPGRVWAILWWYAVAEAGGVVLYPPVNLVANGGFDGTGVNCGEDGRGVFGSFTDVTRTRLPNKIDWPADCQIDADIFEEVAFELSLYDGVNGRLTRLVRRLQKTFASGGR